VKINGRYLSWILDGGGKAFPPIPPPPPHGKNTFTHCTRKYEPESQSECVKDKHFININFVVLPKDDLSGELAFENYCDCPFY
jgi:hypothetical protein